MNEKLLKNLINENNVHESRRKFLKTIAYGSVFALAGCGTGTETLKYGSQQVDIEQTNSIFRRSFSHKTLAFEHAHTGERLKLTYFENGHYHKGALQEINYLLRDFRTDEVHPIDIALLDQLFHIKQKLGFNKPYHILSGYRSPLTNARLRKHSRGVAEHSYHMKGRAIDIRVEGVACKAIKNTALAMADGGVGYYPRSNFVHLDTGRFRTW